MPPVCSAEKRSVDMKKMNPAQSRAGHQERSQPGMRDEARRGWTSGRLGAGRGLRQGWSDTAEGSRISCAQRMISRADLV